MGTQEDIWISSEGDAWFSRNFWKIEDAWDGDPVSHAILTHIVPKMDHFSLNILEFGCSNGWRLNHLQHQIKPKLRAKPRCIGVEPSMEAIVNGHSRYPDIHFDRGTATAFPPGYAGMIDVLIYGFCLYVCDPEDHFEIAAQGNNLLRNQGYLVIHDFDPDFPQSTTNKHVEGLLTYKMDWSKLWRMHPSYTLIDKQSFPDGTAVWVLKKKLSGAFPLCSSEFSDLAPSETDTPET